MKFSRLTFIEDKGIINGNRYWRMQCKCGKFKILRAAYVRAGRIKSCWCLHVELNKGAKYFRHRMCGTPTYYSWNSMKDRCSNPKKHYYFGKVKVCDRWMDFRNFLKDMGKRPANSTLDRIDNSMGYERDNCRWATPKEQARNKRNSRLITFDGQIKTLSEWAEIIGISRTTISARIKRGWSIERSIKTPPNNG